MTTSSIRQLARGIAFGVRTTPKGGRAALEGWWRQAGGPAYVRARVTAAPHDGQANAALVALLAEALGVAKTKVRIVKGASARLKIVEVDGDGVLLANRLEILLAPKGDAP